MYVASHTLAFIFIERATYILLSGWTYSNQGEAYIRSQAHTYNTDYTNKNIDSHLKHVYKRV